MSWMLFCQFTSADFVFQVIKAHFTGLAHLVDLPGIQWVDIFELFSKERIYTEKQNFHQNLTFGS